MAEAVRNVVLKVRYGSDVYGTTTDDSDNDVRGIYVPSVNAHISLREFATYESMTDECDLVLHPVKKFIKLAMNSNPSCLEWLFVPEDKILHADDAGRILIQSRSLFLTRQIYHRYSGFAKSELHRVHTITGRSGARRRKLHMEFGYDSKAAMNVLRLLEQGIELLYEGTLTMPRPNADLLREIKLGRVPLTTVMELITNAEVGIKSAYEKSRLPAECNYDVANNLLVEIVRMFDD